MDTSKISEIGNNLKDSLLQHNPNANVGMSERIVSLGTGAFIAFSGITNILSHPMIALSEMAIGGTLLYRGVTGSCPLKEMLDNQNMNTGSMTVPVTTNTTAGMGSPMTGSPAGMGGAGGTGSSGSAVL